MPCVSFEEKKKSQKISKVFRVEKIFFITYNERYILRSPFYVETHFLSKILLDFLLIFLIRFFCFNFIYRFENMICKKRFYVFLLVLGRWTWRQLSRGPPWDRLSSVAKFTEDSKVMTHFFIFDDGEALYDWLVRILRLITIFQGAQEGREKLWGLIAGRNRSAGDQRGRFMRQSKPGVGKSMPIPIFLIQKI